VKARSVNTRIRNGKCIILIALLSIIFYGCVISAPTMPRPTVKNLNEDYISKGNSKIYYTSTISKDEISALIDFFDIDDYFNQNVNIKLDKSVEDDYSIYIVVHDYVFNDENLIQAYQDDANYISLNLYDLNSVTIFLCNGEFEPIKTIESRWPKKTGE
jgi:hypothetical protein